MRAASFGVPFQPIAKAGLQGSDIPKVTGFKTVLDPYSGEEIMVVPSLKPDWAVIHVNQADRLGNARIFGSPFWDPIVTRAAKRVIVLAEEIVPTETFVENPGLTLIPAFMVTAVVNSPRGARPGSCSPNYEIDEAAVWRYLDLLKSPDGLSRHLEEERAQDHYSPALSAALR